MSMASKYNAICEKCESDMEEGPVLYSEVMDCVVQSYICPLCNHEQEEVVE